MRITSEVLVSRSLDRLQTRLQAYERSQSELGTGKRILKPSDDPAGSRRAISLQSAMRAREQDLANISDGLGWLDTSDSQLQTANHRLARARELVTRAASNTDASERRALTAEIREIAEEIVSIGNHRHLGRPLFGGYSEGDAIEWDGAQWVSNGDDEQVTRRVSDSELVRVNVTAAEWMGFNAGADLPTLLTSVADEIEAGVEVGGRLQDLQDASERILTSLAQIGASTNRIESARSRAQELSLTLRSELSEVQDVDLAQGLMEQQIQQIGYEATLQTLAQALPPSLVAFLR